MASKKYLWPVNVLKSNVSFWCYIL